MQTFHSPIGGKNLTNIFANALVEEFKKESLNNFVEISVTSHTNFFVVNGSTSSDSIKNISELFMKVMNRVNPRYSKNINVIDLVNYGVNNKEIVNTMVDLYKGNDLFIPEEHYDSLVLSNKLYKEDIHINFTADTISGTVHYQPLYHTTEKQAQEKLYELYPDFFLERISDERPNTSDYYFGAWNLNKKYHLFLRYVFHNLSEANMCKGANLRCFSKERIDKLSWETIRFHSEFKNNLIKPSQLYSMVLDLFSFNPEDFESKLKLETYNPHQEILFGENPYPWMIKDKVSEMFVI